ncbi:MAG: urea ABC transporter ATP-binding protein UrtD [Planctomycetes bacterium]|nr:urea ABC transporter ATP-binding protein UrtD [Planctomycetota bacterium]
MGFQSKTVPETIIEVQEVTVDFGGFKAINELNFSIERGELRVVIGPNGAGKTTLLDVITGKTRPTHGRVVFQPDSRPAIDVSDYSAEQIACLGIGRKFQTPNVFKSLSVLENLSLSLKSPRSVFWSLFCRDSADSRARLQEVLDIIGLGSKAHQNAGTLAHGEKQWLELGMLMAQDPELLLVDEPVAGMTPRESERTGELLLAMARKHTLLVIDHDMTFVRQIASKVTVLHEGRLLSQGTIREVQENPKVIEVYLGHHKVAKRPATTPQHAGVNVLVAKI